MKAEISFAKAVETMQKMIEGKVNSSILVEYEVYAGNPEGKRTLESRYDVVDGEVVFGFPGKEIGVTPRIVKDTKWFEEDFGRRMTDHRYETRFYLVF